MALGTTTTTGTLAERLFPRRGLLSNSLVRDGLLVLAGSILMALCARISFPIPTTTVPITLQTFAVLLLGALYGPRLAALTMLAYLGEGLLGLPVFSLGRNAWTPTPFMGLPLIVSSTAGYLCSYPIAAALVGLLATRGWDRKIASALPAMALGNLVILVCGLLWNAGLLGFFGAQVDLGLLLATSVLPFLLGDAIKIGLAASMLPSAWRLLRG